jgi:hypothetical protein
MRLKHRLEEEKSDITVKPGAPVGLKIESALRQLVSCPFHLRLKGRRCFSDVMQRNDEQQLLKGFDALGRDFQQPILQGTR